MLQKKIILNNLVNYTLFNIFLVYMNNTMLPSYEINCGAEYSNNKDQVLVFSNNK